MNGNLCIYYNNTNGLLGKLNKLKYNNNCYKNDVIVFTETKLNDRICDDDILSKEFEIFRKDRPQNGNRRNVRGGGVLIAIKNRRNLKTERITHTNVFNELFDGLEVVCLKLNLLDRIVYICCLYIPSGSNTDVYNQYCIAMGRLKRVVGQDTLIVMGDFNLPNLEWRKKRCDSILLPTRKKSSDKDEIVDLFVEDGFWHPYRKGTGKFLDLVLTNGGKKNVMLGSPYQKNLLVRHEENHQPLIILYNATGIHSINDKHFTLHISDKKCKVSNRKAKCESYDESGNCKRAKTSSC